MNPINSIKLDKNLNNTHIIIKLAQKDATSVPPWTDGALKRKT